MYLDLEDFRSELDFNLFGNFLSVASIVGVGSRISWTFVNASMVPTADWENL